MAKRRVEGANDRELVERTLAELRRGEVAAAYGELVRRYQDRLYNFLLNYTGDPAEAEDVAQEAFVKALAKLSQFEQRSTFFTWLCRIAINELNNRRRKSRPVSGVLGGREEQRGPGVVEPMAEESPEDVVSAGEIRERVRRAIQQLPEEFRLAVTLVDLGQMSYREAAEVMNVPEGTVKSRLARGRRILQELLADLLETKPAGAKSSSS